MALNKTALVAAFIALFEASPETREEAANELATAIDDFVRTGQVGDEYIT